MVELQQNNAHFVTSQNLTEIQQSEWDNISYNKNSYIISDNCDVSFLRYPGYIFSNKEAASNYMKIYNDFLSQNIYTPSRGNLSKSNHYLFIGIRPGHVYAHLSKADTAWLFGPSSSVLHKLLIETNIYPYFTNIYNEPNKPLNKDFKFIFKELIVILYIYKMNYKINELDLVFMGSYDEYPLFVHFVKSNPLVQRFNMKLDFYSIWHPAYLSRGYDDSKFRQWRNQLLYKEKRL